MNTTANILVGLVALLHAWFLILEMFLWNTPYGQRTFKLTPERAAATRTLAANQGLYNGFLAAGLIWGLAMGPAGFQVKVFFLSCVVIAGVFGGTTASRGIFFVQAIPGVTALAFVLTV